MDRLRRETLGTPSPNPGHRGYEENDYDLAQIVRSEGHLSSHIMLETVGTALYSLQRLIRDLQERQVKEALRC